MGRKRVAALLLVTVTAASGCGIVERARDVATSALQTSARPSIVPVDAPDANLANSPVVAAVRSSVVKVRGVADRCQKIFEASGFVVAPSAVMSTAHEVAGADISFVEVDGKTYDAQVVSYDPIADVSILGVPNLTAQPLQFADSGARSGTDAIVLGYPGDGELVAAPARIRQVIELDGPDIYRSMTTTREVYTIRGAVAQGSSGGPLIDVDGRVLGVVFGAAVDDRETGFALTAKEVARQMANVGNTRPVFTGECLSR